VPPQAPCRGWAAKADLVKVDVGGSQSGPHRSHVDLKADRRFADTGRSAQQQDRSTSCGRGILGRIGVLRRRRAGRTRPPANALPHQPRHLGDRPVAGVDAHVSEVGRVHGVGLGEHFLYDAGRLTPAEESPPELVAVDPQAADGQDGARDQAGVQPVRRIDDAGHDNAAGPGRLVNRHHGTEIP
jgi:hypothetical protein